MTGPLRYAAVTPARDERANLERLAASMVAQDPLPAAWIVVDDGSEDGTAELLETLQAEHPWIHAVANDDAGGVLADGRRRGRALDAFRAGVRALPEPVDVVVKTDADTSFDPDYLPRLTEQFALHADLGIAGGACYELEDGEWVRQKVIPTHPRGASRAYRWACLGAVMELESRMGWDGLDEVKARMQGYRSQTILELGFRHHRATGGRERGRFAHYAAQGSAAWYMGYRPGYLTARTLYRGLREPAAVGMLWGYAVDAAARRPRHPEPDVRRELRRGQRLTSVLTRGVNP